MSDSVRPHRLQPNGSPVPGILQARTLEWVAISFSNAWKWNVKVKSLSRVRLLATPWTAAHQAPPSMGFSRQEYWSGVPWPSPDSEHRWALMVAGSSIGYCYSPGILCWGAEDGEGVPGRADHLCSLGSPTSDSATSCQALCWALCGEGRQQQQGWESPICSPWLSRAWQIQTWCDSEPVPRVTRRSVSRATWGLRGCTQLLTVSEPLFITRASI